MTNISENSWSPSRDVKPGTSLTRSRTVYPLADLQCQLMDNPSFTLQYEV